MEHAILLVLAVLLLIWGGALIIAGASMGLAAAYHLVDRNGDRKQGLVVLPGFIFGLVAGGLLIWAGVSVWP